MPGADACRGAVPRERPSLGQRQRQRQPSCQRRLACPLPAASGNHQGPCPGLATPLCAAHRLRGAGLLNANHLDSNAVTLLRSIFIEEHGKAPSCDWIS